MISRAWQRQMTEHDKSLANRSLSGPLKPVIPFLGSVSGILTLISAGLINL